MADLWVANSEVYEVMKKVLRECHVHLLEIIDEIRIVMTEKASMSCPTGSTKKINQVSGVIIEAETGKDVKFVLEIPADVWGILSNDGREALMDHRLCACGLDYNEETEEIKYSVRKPEIQMFKGEIRRRGVWMDISEEGDGCNDIVDKVESAVGVDADN